ncbi:MAG: hypothetical protein V4590_12190 [Bacteroidota bacterium]
MLRIITLCFFVPLCVFAQEEGERFWSGFVEYNTNISNNGRILSSGTYSNDHSTSYYLNTRISKGKFISKGRAFSYGILGTVNYSESDFIKINGDNRYTISYQLGAQFGLSKYYVILPKFYATVNHDFSYQYQWNEGNDVFANSTNTHSILYRLSPGMHYRVKPRWGLQLNLSLFSLAVRRSLSSDSQSRSETQRINVNLFSGTTLGNLTFGVLYFPFQSQRKNTK